MISSVNVQWAGALVTAANTSKVGTGTVDIIFEALADSYVDRVVFRAAGTNVASVGRLFTNNGQPTTTAQNNALFSEVTLAATTLDEAAAFTEQKITADLWLPKGYRLFVTLGTAVASGYMVTAVAGPYDPQVVAL